MNCWPSGDCSLLLCIKFHVWTFIESSTQIFSYNNICTGFLEKSADSLDLLVEPSVRWQINGLITWTIQLMIQLDLITSSSGWSVKPLDRIKFNDTGVCKLPTMFLFNFSIYSFTPQTLRKSAMAHRLLSRKQNNNFCSM